jgi:sugar phosphate isomerase/epimerase
MARVRIGVRLESLELPLRRALAEAARLGVAGVQIDAVGDLSPAALSQTGRRELRHLLRSQNVELTAVGCPLRRGLDVAENQEARIEHVKKVLALSFELGPRIAIVQAGQVPQDANSPGALLLSEALLALGQYGDRVGAVLALETGPEDGATLAGFLARFDTGGLGANLDPANLLMNGYDPMQSAAVLGSRIVHAHAKDARRWAANRVVQEVPLGNGDIDWLQFLGVLEEVEYRGWLTIERETGTNRLADIEGGVAFLRRLGVS